VLLLRRAHLYLGLFLFPWAILYGITAVLFNHPSWFSDQRMSYFSAKSLAGTPLEQRLTPNEQADLFVTQLNERRKPTTPFQRVSEAKYNREFAFGLCKVDGQTVNWLVDLKQGSGTIRSTVDQPKPTPKRVPFLEAPTSPAPVKNTPPERFVIDYPIREKLEASMPKVLQDAGYPTGPIQVTSVPDVVFSLEADGEIWQASYNPLTGQLGAISTSEITQPELSTRRFLLRLHKLHGYPSDQTALWFWAILVDVMGLVLVFWGFSGLFMWWQIKATRRLGAILLLISAISAVGLTWAMYQALTVSA
jgi:hypothetical protein